jgi:hypothetical protein
MALTHTWTTQGLLGSRAHAGAGSEHDTTVSSGSEGCVSIPCTPHGPSGRGRSVQGGQKLPLLYLNRDLRNNAQAPRKKTPGRTNT